MQTNLQAPAVLLNGATGSGKTFSISTLIEAGLEVFVITTEPTGLDSLLDVMEKKKLDINKLHYRSISPARADFAGLEAMAKKVALLDFEGMAKLKPSGDRAKAQWITLLQTLSNFNDERTGKSYGDVATFDNTRAVVVDSLSGLNVMAMDIVIGDKLSAHMGEWGLAMSLLEKLLTTLSSSLRCTFVLTAHLERETNEITGGTTVMTSTLGKKLAPKVPRFFSEVIMAYREGESFYWSTTATGVDLKQRSLPLSAKLPPDFKPIVEAYNRRLSQSKLIVPDEIGPPQKKEIPRYGA